MTEPDEAEIGQALRAALIGALERPARPHRHRRAAASARQKRYRRRADAGRIVVSVVIDEQTLGLLIATHWLADRDAGDRGKIGRAIERMLADAAR